MKLNLKKKTTSQVLKNSEVTAVLNIQSPEELAEFIKKHRKKHKLSQGELAQFADISRLAVSEFENGKSDIRLSTLLKIIKACSLSLQIKER